MGGLRHRRQRRRPRLRHRAALRAARPAGHAGGALPQPLRSRGSRASGAITATGARLSSGGRWLGPGIQQPRARREIASPSTRNRKSSRNRRDAAIAAPVLERVAASGFARASAARGDDRFRGCGNGRLDADLRHQRRLRREHVDAAAALDQVADDMPAVHRHQRLRPDLVEHLHRHRRPARAGRAGRAEPAPAAAGSRRRLPAPGYPAARPSRSSVVATSSSRPIWL